jgi:transposase-like protein
LLVRSTILLTTSERRTTTLKSGKEILEYVREQRRQGVTVAKIAQDLGWSNEGIRKVCLRAGIPTTHPLQEPFEFRPGPLDTPCRVWLGSTASYGYGQVHRKGGGERYVHRRAWVEANGPIPPGLFVCHRCDVPACYEVSHLFLGTNRDNSLDCEVKGRRHHPSGAEHGGSKLTPEQVREIRATIVPRRGVRGGGIRGAAERYGVKPGTLYAVLSGRTYRDL